MNTRERKELLHKQVNQHLRRQMKRKRVCKTAVKSRSSSVGQVQGEKKQTEMFKEKENKHRVSLIQNTVEGFFHCNTTEAILLLQY